MKMENGHPDISEANSESTDVDPYENKYYALLRRCENIQQSNERLVHRLYRIKGILRRLRHERRFLMRRLDQCGDKYKDVPLRIPIGIDDELPCAASSSAAVHPEVVNAAPANSASSFNLNAQSTEHDLLRNDVYFPNQLNTPGQPTSSNSASTSTATVGNATGHILPTSKKKNEKSSSKNNKERKKSSVATVSVTPPAVSGLFLKNALSDYEHLTKLNNDSSEKT